MMKFILAARRKRHDTREKYFYELGVVHVALMLTTPSVIGSFKRYVQHYSISGVTNDDVMYPFSAMEWDNMADHWLDDYADLIRPNTSPDYLRRMQPHNFGDSAFALEMTSGHVVHEIPGFTSGGVNLVHFIKKRPEISQGEFARRWREEHGAVVMDALAGTGILRKYVQNAQLPMDPAIFKGTFFEAGGVGQHAGIEQYWFKDLDDLRRLSSHSDIGRKIKASSDRLFDAANTFTMVTTERVLYDYTVPGKESPRAAVLNPASLEAQILKDGLGDWHIPKPPA